ncbi:hypothetical protein GA0061096_0151 [Fictibacillus enclensis]|nr:hypothetical protein GA0061096_0151 [Fictibacillus enclensis]
MYIRKHSRDVQVLEHSRDVQVLEHSQAVFFFDCFLRLLLWEQFFSPPETEINHFQEL